MSSAADLFNTDDAADFGAGAFFCAEGIVARNDDPENRCRVQCVVPMIDEDEIHEIWARRIQLYVGAPGYGDYFVPELGAAVMLLGRLGDTHSLFYAPIFNETNLPSADFPDQTVSGVRVPGDHKIIADLDVQIRGGRLNLEADGSIRITAPGGIFLNSKKIA
jgi:hypothetical protein